MFSTHHLAAGCLFWETFITSWGWCGREWGKDRPQLVVSWLQCCLLSKGCVAYAREAWEWLWPRWGSCVPGFSRFSSWTFFLESHKNVPNIWRLGEKIWGPEACSLNMKRACHGSCCLPGDSRVGSMALLWISAPSTGRLHSYPSVSSVRASSQGEAFLPSTVYLVLYVAVFCCWTFIFNIGPLWRTPRKG